MNLFQALFGKKYDDEALLRRLTETTWDGRTIVNPHELFASQSFKEAVKFLIEKRNLVLFLPPGRF